MGEGILSGHPPTRTGVIFRSLLLYQGSANVAHRPSIACFLFLYVLRTLGKHGVPKMVCSPPPPAVLAPAGFLVWELKTPSLHFWSVAQGETA